MAKGKGRGFQMPIGSRMGGMAEQLRKLQEDMLAAQEALGEETIETSAGGGAVRVVINGHLRLVSLTIDPEAVNPEDVEMLQDLIIAAVNEAIEKAQEMAAERMSGFAAGLKIPGLF